MNLNFFKTPKNLPFLFYKKNEFGGISLHADTVEMGVNCKIIPKTIKVNSKNLNFALRIISNKVGFYSKRYYGNIILVPSEEFKSQILFVDLPEIICHVDTSLAPNELMATCWKIVNGLAVDGGVQVTPYGISYNPNFENYFCNCFLG